MSKTNEAVPQAQNAQLVYIVTRYGSIYGVYGNIELAQDVQKTFIAKGNICDLQVQMVKTQNL